MTNPTKERALDFCIFKDLDIPEMSIPAHPQYERQELA